jgi:diacylglycerol kinase (ATP)
MVSRTIRFRRETLNSGEKKSTVKIFVILNPVAGNASADEIHSELEKNFPADQYTVDVHETTGEEDVARLVKEACKNGAKLVIAAGGDGTVAGAVNGLISSNIPLGIIPVGTGNGLARALQIPLKLPEAAELLAQDHDQMRIDAMKIGSKYFILNAGAGIGARAMKGTLPQNKRKFGMLAYASTILSEAIHYRPKTFILTVDGKKMQVRATEILISNSKLLEDNPRPLGEPEEFTDGLFDVYIIGARSILDYIRMIFQVILKTPREARHIKHISINKGIRIETAGSPQPTQGDGEVIGHTPLSVDVVPEAVSVIVPKAEP